MQFLFLLLYNEPIEHGGIETNDLNNSYEYDLWSHCDLYDSYDLLLFI